jgi:hypothetical protein
LQDAAPLEDELAHTPKSAIYIHKRQTVPLSRQKVPSPIARLQEGKFPCYIVVDLSSFCFYVR